MNLLRRWESGPNIPGFSLHRPTMRLKSGNIWPCSPTSSLRSPITRQAPRRSSEDPVRALVVGWREAASVHGRGCHHAGTSFKALLGNTHAAAENVRMSAVGCSPAQMIAESVIEKPAGKQGGKHSSSSGRLTWGGSEGLVFGNTDRDQIPLRRGQGDLFHWS
jgi:hypothetical protein